jgi:signal transduction histidine kinase
VSRIPIRLRIAVLAAAVAAVAASLIAVIAVTRSEAAIHADFDVSLGEEAAEALIAVQAGVALDTFRHPGTIYGVQRVGLFDESGVLLEATAPAPPPLPPAQRAGGFFTVQDPASGNEFRALSLPVELDGRGEILVVTVPTKVLTDRHRSLSLGVAAAIGLSTLFAGLGAYVLTGLVLGPIEQLRRSAVELAEEPRGRRLDVPLAKDDVRRLAETLNEALARTDEMLETQRRFLAEASHELRTPLTRLRAEVDLARRPGRSHEELVIAMADVDEHIEHLTSLADNLLTTLTPQSTPGRLPHPVTVNQIMANLRHMANHGDSIHIDVPDKVGDTSVIAEPVVLVGVLSNMVGNAFRHGAPPVEVSVQTTDTGLSFAICDCGPGIPAEVREQVMRPYVQGPAATSGSGLGLSIVHNYAVSQGGELLIEDADPGCRMVLCLPFEFVTN